jgi:hypothetical protein
VAPPVAISGSIANRFVLKQLHAEGSSAIAHPDLGANLSESVRSVFDSNQASGDLWAASQPAAKIRSRSPAGGGRAEIRTFDQLIKKLSCGTVSLL